MYLKKRVVWLKMLFWVSWDVMTKPDQLQSVVDQLSVDTDLVFKGFASSTADEDPKAAPLLEHFFSDKTCLWLQFPPSLNEEPCLYQLRDVSTGEVPYQLLDLNFGSD